MMAACPITVLLTFLSIDANTGYPRLTLCQTACSREQVPLTGSRPAALRLVKETEESLKRDDGQPNISRNTSVRKGEWERHT